VDDDLVDPSLPERDGERRGLDKLRTVADDGHHAHRASVVPRVRRPTYETSDDWLHDVGLLG
jgi:hypothetical protein